MVWRCLQSQCVVEAHADGEGGHARGNSTGQSGRVDADELGVVVARAVVDLHHAHIRGGACGGDGSVPTLGQLIPERPVLFGGVQLRLRLRVPAGEGLVW